MRKTTTADAIYSLRMLLPLCMLVLIAASGCIGASAQLMYVLFGHKTKAEFAGLEQNRVAVVTVTEDNSFGPDPLSEMVSRAVTMRLVENVKKIDVVPQGEIEDWMDSNGWGRPDFKELGRGVKADTVVVIEISDYRIHEGATLYKGHASYKVDVFDMTDEGRMVFTRGPKEFVFPRDGRPSIESPERQFEIFYLNYLTNEIARYFYSYDSTETAAVDSALMH